MRSQVRSSGKPPLAYWRTQHSSLSKRTSSQNTSKAVEELNHLHQIDIYTPAQTSRTNIQQAGPHILGHKTYLNKLKQQQH